MQGDKFYLEIQGNKVQISEPWDFSKVEFSITQDKDYFFRKLSFAGNKADLKFIKSQHKNIFNLLLQEYTENGFNAEVYFYYNDSIKMRLDFTSAETNYYDSFKCQAINDTILDTLNDNKDVKVDLLSEKDIYENYYPALDLFDVYIDGVVTNKQSLYINASNFLYVPTFTGLGGASFNNIREIKKSELKDTYTPFREVWGDISPLSILKNGKILKSKNNLRNVKIDLKMNKSSFESLEGNNVFSCTIVIGEDIREGESVDSWWARCFKKDLFVIENWFAVTEDVYTYVHDSMSRYDCIWFCFRTNKRGNFTCNSNTLTITADSTNYGSVTTANTYDNCIKNLVSKIVNINNVKFNVDENLQAKNMLFSGNQVRFGNEKPFVLTWKDVTEQLKEFGLGYRLEGSTIVFDRIESFYEDKFVHNFDKIDSSSFKITHDDTYNVNVLEYKYKKYQALKEGSIEGNAGTINGESQWYIQNKYTDNSVSIDLPISRDKFLLEDTRVQALAYNTNTSTTDDSTLYLFDKTQGTKKISETAYLRASFDQNTNMQTFAVYENEFSWDKIGVRINTVIIFYVNGLKLEYIVRSSSENIITCEWIAHRTILNQDSVFSFSFYPEVRFTINTNTSNNSKSIRQNLNKMRAYLDTYNYYTYTSISNREYKENGNFVFNGIKETDPIQKLGFGLTPKIVEFKAKDTFSTFKKIENNVNGYCTVKSISGELIKFYIKEVSIQNNSSNCEEVNFNVKGQIFETNESECSEVPPYIIIKDEVNGNYYPNLKFIFNDQDELISANSYNTCVFKDSTFFNICSTSYCMSSYEGAKQYLQSL